MRVIRRGVTLSRGQPRPVVLVLLVLEVHQKSILTLKLVTFGIKMPGYKRRRGAGGSGGGMSRSYRQLPFGSFRVPRAGARLRASGSASMSAALSRVHTFKRLGEPLVLRNNLNNRVDASGNATMLGASPAYVSDPTVGGNFTQIRMALRFTLGQAANISEITSLFDNYRIKQVKLRFDMSYDSPMGAVSAGVAPAAITGGPYSNPLMHYCYDPDDSITPTSRIPVLENGYAKTVRLDKGLTITVNPRVQSVVQATSTTTAGGLLPLGHWLDTASVGVEHFGLKAVIDYFPFLSADNIAFLTITPTFIIEAKNVV